MPIKYSKTKIIATIGPACSSPQTLEQMIKAGVDICRINFSHGTYDKIKEIIHSVREINKKLGTYVGILADLQGPKLRIGDVKNNSVELREGEDFIITTKQCTGNEKQVYITYSQFPKDVEEGDNVLIDDGKILLKVISTNRKDCVKTKIIHGGILSSKKGVNLPNTKISLPCLTPKDEKDLKFALDNGVEWIGLSFVRSVTDIVDLKGLIKKHKIHARVIAKIEKPAALDEIDNIIDMADGVMVARGDLGVELPLEQVPLVQKMIVKKCRRASKPVIIATQMMESMIQNFTPTRAEVNDVANAVLDGADAVMLSGETSVGKFPVKVIETMQKIVLRAEEENLIYFREHEPTLKNQTYVSDSICYTACLLAKQARVSAIISMTNSGYTAFKISSQRPKANIFIFTDNHTLLTSLNLVWGVRGFYYNKYESTDNTISDLKNYLQKNGLVQTDDLVINIASMPMSERGRTNMLKLSQII